MTPGIISARAGNYSRRHFTVTLAILGGVVFLSAQDQRSVFRSEADAVSVPVSVRTIEKAVAGLKASDFELKDNGVVQSIESFSVETLPIDVTLLLDLSRSVEGPRLDRLTYSVGETALLLHADDRFRVIGMQHVLREVFPFQPGGSKPNVESLKAYGGHVALRRAGGGDDARGRARSTPAHRRLHGRPGHDQHPCRSTPCAR